MCYIYIPRTFSMSLIQATMLFMLPHHCESSWAISDFILGAVCRKYLGAQCDTLWIGLLRFIKGLGLTYVRFSICPETSKAHYTSQLDKMTHGQDQIKKLAFWRVTSARWWNKKKKNDFDNHHTQEYFCGSERVQQKSSTTPLEQNNLRLDIEQSKRTSFTLLPPHYSKMVQLSAKRDALTHDASHRGG